MVVVMQPPASCGPRRKMESEYHTGDCKKIVQEIHVIAHDIPLCWWDYVPGGLKIKEYFDLTSLHGFKYFSESGRSLSERYFWIVALTLVYVGAVIAVYDQIMYYMHTPVLITIDDKPTPVWDIPFPAITICSENQVRPSYFNHSAFEGSANMTQEQLELFEYILLSCRSNLTSAKLEFLSPDLLDRVHHEIWQHCDDTFLMSWMSETVENPCKIFQPALTGAGACHTFNGLPGDLLYRPSVYNFLNEHNHKIKSSNEGATWSPDRGYFTRQRSESPPWRMPGGGFGQDATFILNLNIQDFDGDCFFGGHGFLVIFHSPAELPTLVHPATYVHADHLAVVKITPDIKKTDEVLRNWAPAERGCFFEDERALRYFNIYTEKNCDLECETNISLSTCGCAPYYAPHTKEIPICGPLKQQCFLESISKSLDPLASGCNCLPACFEVDYKINVANYRRNWSIAKSKGFTFDGIQNLIEDNFAVVAVQYQTQKVTAMKRIAVFGLSDFIDLTPNVFDIGLPVRARSKKGGQGDAANIGGLLGLFLGFSFLSLFEVVYFCTLRFKNRNVIMKVAPVK